MGDFAAVSAVAVSRAARTHRRHPLDLSASKPSNVPSARRTGLEQTSAVADIAAALAAAVGRAGMIPTRHPRDPNAQLALLKFKSNVLGAQFLPQWPHLLCPDFFCVDRADFLSRLAELLPCAPYSCRLFLRLSSGLSDFEPD